MKSVTESSPPFPLICRVCLSEEVRCLPLGEYAAFFRLRVDTNKDPFRIPTEAAIFQPGLDISDRFRVFEKTRQALLSLDTSMLEKSNRTLVQSCSRCLAVTLCHEYSYSDLEPLYLDYRSETYNRDRISVEPSYKDIALSVGNHPMEQVNRNRGVDRFLARHLSSFPRGEALDFGGSDGRFIPPGILNAFTKVDIFDTSAAPIHSSVPQGKAFKVSSPRQGAYAFLMCMHVVEHVGNPRAFVEHMAKYVSPGGLMYIEVPIDLTFDLRHRFLLGEIERSFIIHEHINLYDFGSLIRLIESFDQFSLVDAKEEEIDHGWHRDRNGRYLVRRVS